MLASGYIDPDMMQN